MFFNLQKEAQAALKKDRELIGSRPMFVSKCDPDKETRGSGFKYSSNMEKNKLFIRGLPFTTTVDDLRNIFNKFGFIKDVRLVTYRNGHSKGLAYVEYEDEVRFEFKKFYRKVNCFFKTFMFIILSVFYHASFVN